MTGKEKLYWKMNEARELIAKGHCKGSAATDINGEPCCAYEVATNYCIIGANQHVMPMDVDMRLESYRRLLGVENTKRFDSAYTVVLSKFNDAESTTTEDVLEMFDDAMDKLKKEMESEQSD